MITSSNGTIVRVTGPLCGEFTGQCTMIFALLIHGFISMRTSSYLRALLINNTPCGQRFSKLRLTKVSDAYTGTYTDLCNTIFYFGKLQASRSVLVGGPTCGMHVFDGFFDNFFGHFRPAIRYGALPRGSHNLYKMLPTFSSSI